MAKNPQFCNKTSLLNCVEIINQTCNLKPKLQVKTKTIDVILTSIYVSLQELDPFKIIEDTPQETLCELVLWGVLDVEFLGEEVPDATREALNKIDTDTIQAEDTLEWGENEATPKQKEQAKEDKAHDPFVKVNLKAEAEAIIKKMNKAEKKGKTKKVKALSLQLDAVEKQLLAVDEEFPATKPEQPKPKPKAKPQPKFVPNPRVAEINGLLETLRDNMPTKKKKAKKVQAKIDELEEELSSIPAEVEVTKSRSPKQTTTDGGPTRGVTARANRPIPNTISWPKEGTVTATIVSCCQKKKGATVKDIINALAKAFPERAVSGMTKTVNALVGGKGLPLPLHYTKGIPCEVEGDGTPEKRIFIKVKE